MSDKSGRDEFPETRRQFLRAAGTTTAIGFAATSHTQLALAAHEEEPCDVAIDFRGAKLGQVSNVQAADITSLTVFYFDGDRDAQKQESIDPTISDTIGEAGLRVRYARGKDQTIIQIGGRTTSLRRIVAFGPDCRSAATNPFREAAGDNEGPIADFTWSPENPVVGESVTFTSTATDPDAELIHYGWDFTDDESEDATGREVTHTFDTDGEFDVTHTVIDDFDATDATTRTVAVDDPAVFELVTTLFADDAEPDDGFGRSVSIDGDTAIIAAPYKDELGGGAAYVFTRTANGWRQQAKLTADDGEPDPRFGHSVSISGDYAIVGAPFSLHSPIPSEGSAYLFRRNGSSWSQEVKLTGSEPQYIDGYGQSVSLDGETAVVSAPTSPEFYNGGKTYVYTRDGEAWNEQSILEPPTDGIVGGFGETVSLDGDTVVVGAGNEYDIGDRTGDAFVFARLGTTWERQAHLTSSDPEPYDRFGGQVAVDDETVLVTASRRPQVSVFTQENDWAQQATFMSDSEQNALGVSVDEDTALVDTEQGGPVVFSRSDETWSQLTTLDVDGSVSPESLSGTVAIVGDSSNDEQGSDAGAAYVFE